MGIIDQAKAAGFSKVETFMGLIDLELFPMRHSLGFTFSINDGAFFGPTRPATTMEAEIMKSQGLNLISYKARDKFILH